VDGLPQANDPREFKIHGAGAIVSELFGLFLCCEVFLQEYGDLDFRGGGSLFVI
jgi:hypothetical protein